MTPAAGGRFADIVDTCDMPPTQSPFSSPAENHAGVDWRTTALPDGWPDRLRLRRPRQLLLLLRCLLGRRRSVLLPDGLPGAELVPSYACQEFHHLPNGNYSKRFVDGYVRWFDRMMLGRTVAARATIARRLAAQRSVLDAGCGAGELAGALIAAGVADVWGLDPSPYMLHAAAQRHPAVHFVQGVVERATFADAQFDGVGVSFLFHELPPDVADAALDQLHRVLTPGGLLVVAEPSPLHFHPSALPFLLRTHGMHGLYFMLFARIMHEPFATAWHQRDVATWLPAHGFALLEDTTGVPIRHIVAQRRH